MHTRRSVFYFVFTLNLNPKNVQTVKLVCENTFHLTIQHALPQVIFLQMNPMKNETLNKIWNSNWMPFHCACALPWTQLQQQLHLRKNGIRQLNLLGWAPANRLKGKQVQKHLENMWRSLPNKVTSQILWHQHPYLKHLVTKFLVPFLPLLKIVRCGQPRGCPHPKPRKGPFAMVHVIHQARMPW